MLKSETSSPLPTAVPALQFKTVDGGGQRAMVGGGRLHQQRASPRSATMPIRTSRG